jgi:hypothetical protein
MGRISPDKPPIKNDYGDILQIYKQLILFERQNQRASGSPARNPDTVQASDLVKARPIKEE